MSHRSILQNDISLGSIERERVDSIEAFYLLEKHGPLSIMSIQVHFLVQIVEEVAIDGIVHYGWMFSLERFMKTLK